MRFDSIVNSESTQTIMMNFSIGSSPVSMKDIPTMRNFSNDPKSELIDYEIKCFSLLERIRLAKRTPRQILRLRVNEVARYLRMSTADKIKENKYTIVQYLNEYVYEIIVKLMNEPGLKPINLRLQLGLPSLIRNLTSVRRLELFLLQAKREYKNKGYLTKRIQDELSKYYTQFMNEFLLSIEDRYLKNSGKEGIISGNSEVVSQNPIKLAAFSTEAEPSKYSNILDTIYEIIESDTDNLESLYSKLCAYNKDEKITENIMDDQELTKLLNNYIETRSDSAKNDIKAYLTRTVQFSEELKVPNFSLSMKEVTELSGGSLPEIQNEVRENKIEESNKLASKVDNLDDILPSSEEIYSNTPGFKSGVINNFGKRYGYVAMKSDEGYNVKLYSIPKSIKVSNFSNWSKVPYKSIKVSAMDELNKMYIR